MAKLTLTDIASLSNETSVVAAINSNNSAIETALEKTLSRDGQSPNSMEATLDMNSNHIINLPPPASDNEPVTKAYMENLYGTGVALDGFRYLEDFGAVGDGATDDIEAFELALAHAASSGEEIRGRSKTYAISRTLYLKDRGVVLSGQWAGGVFSGQPTGSRIKWIGASNGVMIAIESLSVSPVVLSGILLQGWQIDGNNLAGYGLKLGSVQACSVKNVGVYQVSQIGVWFTTTWSTNSNILNYRNTLDKIYVSSVGASCIGFLFDGHTNISGGFNTSFLSGRDLHVTHTNGIAFFFLKCDDVHLYNIAASRVAGGTGEFMRFASRPADQKMATGNIIWGAQSSTSSGSPTINVELVSASSPFTARNNKIYIASVDFQPTITGPGAYLLEIEDIGSYSNSIRAYKRSSPTTNFVETTEGNNVYRNVTLERRSTDAPAAGIGTGIEFDIQTAASNIETAASIDVIATDVTSTSEDFAFVFNLMKAGAALSEVARINEFGIGYGATPTVSNLITASRNNNSFVGATLSNTNAGSSATCGATYTSNSGALTFVQASTAGGAYGFIGTTGSAGLFFESPSSHSIRVGGTAKLTVTSALTTIATNTNVTGTLTTTGLITSGAGITSNGDLLLTTTDTGALGSTTKMWSDLFLASGGVINWNNGDVTATHSANKLDFAGATSGYQFDAGISVGTAPSTAAFTAASTSAFQPQILLTNETVGTSGAIWNTRKSRAGAAVSVGDSLGSFAFLGTDAGNTFRNSCIIQVLASAVGASSVDSDIKFALSSGGSFFGSLILKSTRSVTIGETALATTATDGFLYIPTCAGTPTGVPTTLPGTAPIVINTTNNKLYFYSSGAWRDAGP